MMKTIIRYRKTRISVLCEKGHLIDSFPLKDWAGSMFAADCAFHSEGDRFERLAERCNGFGHEKKEGER